MEVEDVKTYIESGILELYVLGQLTVAENMEVEAMAKKHKEVKLEITAIELALEADAIENAIRPTKDLESKIFAQITPNINVKDTKVVSIYNDNNKRIKTLRFALVACIALLVISVVALLSVYTELSSAKDQIASLSTQKDQYAATASQLEFEKAGMENVIAMTESNEWTTVKLAGVNKATKSKMLVYWNKTNKNILINYAAMDLPKADPNHEYQLWALVDGKPVSLGVFGLNAKEAVKQMETIQKAQAFAVTIEPVGGSLNPTMEKMVVMGGVAI